MAEPSGGILGLGWGLQLAALEAQRRQDHKAWLELRESLEDNSYLRRGPELLRRHAPDGMARQWLEADPEDQAGMDHPSRIRAVVASTFAAAGRLLGSRT